MKIIIWGHKLHQSTHSYVHSSYYRAFKYLGYETYWVDETDDISSIDLSDSIIFTEGSVSEKMPINSSSKYILHHVDSSNLDIPQENILNLCNYLHREEMYEKIAELTYWDKNTKTLYQPWGTDLLPHEIDENDYVRYNPSPRDLNYVAMLCDKELWWWVQEFANLLMEKNNCEFRIFTQQVSDQENRELIRNSFLCPDFRANWHLECGYIPCRIWKNISYGRIVGTNSPFIKRALGEHVVYAGTPETLYEVLIDAERNNKVDMKNAMLYVKNNHTFINRVNNLLKFI
jgi:hypothetical protein